MSDLHRFRRGLEPLMHDSTWRPFVARGGDPYCNIFLVGNNAAHVAGSFWNYWDDHTGFLYEKWRAEYDNENETNGVRARLDWLAAELGEAFAHRCLETNAYAVPSPMTMDLPRGYRKTAIFDYLLEEIHPRIVVAFGEHARRHLRSACQAPIWQDVNQKTGWPVWCGQFGIHSIVILEPRNLMFLSRQAVTDLANWVSYYDRP